MNMPKVVKVGSLAVQVKRVKQKATREDTSGEYRSAEGVIEIDADLAASPARLIFAHELDHAIWHEAGLYEVVKAVKPDEIEEAVVYAHSAGWLDVLRRNPAVVKYLLAP